MSTASVANAFVASTTIESAKVNENFQDLVAFLNTSVVQSDGSTPMSGALTLPGVPTSALHAATKSYVDAATSPGAMTTWLPTLTQSAIVAKTNNDSKYIKIGRFVFCQWHLTVTGSGTAANIVQVSLPVAGRNAGQELFLGGHAEIYDTSALTHYQGAPVLFGTGTAMAFRPSAVDVGLGFQYLGLGDFSAGLAVGDVVRGSAIYEAAS